MDGFSTLLIQISSMFFTINLGYKWNWPPITSGTSRDGCLSQLMKKPQQCLNKTPKLVMIRIKKSWRYFSTISLLPICIYSVTWISLIFSSNRVYNRPFFQVLPSLAPPSPLVPLVIPILLLYLKSLRVIIKTSNLWEFPKGLLMSTIIFQLEATQVKLTTFAIFSCVDVGHWLDVFRIWILRL
jgi:hypothetical protein